MAVDIRKIIGKTVNDCWKYLAKSCGLSRGQIEAMAPAFSESQAIVDSVLKNK